MTCTGVQCPAIPAVSHSTHSSLTNWGRFPDSVTYTCESGYKHAAESTKQCTAEGEWSNNVECVGVPCNQTVTVPNAVAQPATNDGKYPSNIHYDCDKGYIHKGTQAFKSCTASGLWTGSVQCTGVTCPAPPQVANAQAASPSNDGKFPSSVSYACAEGFELEDPQEDSNHCNTDAIWSDNIRCRGILCEPPPSVQHATIADSTAIRRYPSSITYACQSGYEAVDSRDAKTCNLDGTWSGAVKCVEKKCKVVLGENMVPHGANGCNSTNRDEIFLSTESNKACDVKCNESSVNSRIGIS